MLDDVRVLGERVWPPGVIDDHALAGSHHGLKQSLGKTQRRLRLRSQHHLDRIRAGCSLRLDLQLVVAEKSKYPASGTGMFERDGHQRLDQVVEDDLARNGL